MSESDIFTIFISLFIVAALIGTTIGMLEMVFGKDQDVS